jgi:glycosyltransferase involved in cell wall biosynthesis
MTWHIITSEYPPQAGGVSDYTKLVARGLADAGDEVHVWCPSLTSAANERGAGVTTDAERVTLHRDFGHFSSADLRRVSGLLDRFPAPRRLLVQWVPHGYGYRSMNLRFCWWLRNRGRRGDIVELMVHEPYLAFREGSLKQDGVAVVHRLMTAVLLSAVNRVWMSIPAWEARLRPYAFGRKLPFAWLPVASNIPVVDDPGGVKAIRDRFAPHDAPLVGHFGTYDRSIVSLLLQSASALLRANPNCNLLLLGRGSELMQTELSGTHPDLAQRIHAAGTLPAADLSLHLSACDVMLQPYVDGVSSRRTSVMVALAHGLPVVTTQGKLTEPLWAESEAVKLAPPTDVDLLVSHLECLLINKTERLRIREAAKALYQKRFDIRLTVDALRKPAA